MHSDRLVGLLVQKPRLLASRHFIWVVSDSMEPMEVHCCRHSVTREDEEPQYSGLPI